MRSITKEPRYAEIIDQYESLWALEDLPNPLWQMPTPPGIVILLAAKKNIVSLLKDREAQLKAELMFLRLRENMPLEDHFVPHLQPQQGVGVFASAFGCEVRYLEHTFPWAYPVIGKGDPPEKVYDLPKPDVTDGQLGAMLEFTEYFAEKTEDRYPIAVTDLQGPMDTAYLIWDTVSLMKAMFTNPDEVHYLMRSVTDLITDYVKEQRARCKEFLPCHFPSLWLPDGEGIAISDDCLAVLGSNQYKEFSIPYCNELSKEFGGLFIHSCGNFVHQLDVLEEIHNLRGINFGATETPFKPVWDRFGGRTVIAPHLGLNVETHFDTAYQFLEHILKNKTSNRGLIILPTPITEEPAKMADPSYVADFSSTVARMIEEYS